MQPASLRFRHSFAVAASVSVFLISSRSSAAELGRNTLQVVRSQTALDCPDDSALAKAVQQLGSEDEQISGMLILEVQIDHVGNQYTANIRVSGRKTGDRQLSSPGPSCASLADALAITLAILSDRALSTPDPKPFEPVHKDPTTETKAPDPPIPSPLHGGASLSSGIAYGLPNRFSWMAGGGVDLRRDRYELSLSFFYAASSEEDFGKGKIRVGLWGGQLGLCSSIVGNWDKLHFGVCGVAALGRLNGQGLGYNENQSQHRPWIAAGLGIRLGFPKLGPVQPAVSLSCLAPLVEETFSIDGIGRAFSTRPLGVFGNLHLRLPIF